MRPWPADILIAKSDESAAEWAAEATVVAALKTTRARGTFTLAIPGGETPRRLFELLASSEFASLIPWAKTHVFFTDERAVPPDHMRSNFRQASELLLSRVPIPANNIHRIKGELPLDEAAEAYEAEMRQVLGEPPAIDLLILGMGEDTHTASLFPDSDALRAKDKLVTRSRPDDTEDERLTLTVSAICEAAQTLVLVIGERKAHALRIALRGSPNPKRHPIHAVTPTHGRMIWIVDEAAAGEL